MAAGSESGMIAIWTNRGDPDRTWRGHDGKIYDLEWHPDGQALATVGADGYLVFCDRGQSGLIKKTVESKISKEPRSLAWSPNGTMIAIGYEEGTVQIWNYPEFEVQTAPQRPGRFSSLEWAPILEGLDILGGGGSPDGSALVWGVWGRSGLYEKLRGHRDEITDLTFSSDGSILATCSKDGAVKIWQTTRYEVYGEKMIGGLVEVFSTNDNLTSISWSSDDSLLASGEAGTLYRFSIPDRLLWNKDTHTTQIRGVSCSPDSQRICYNPNTHDIAIYDMVTGWLERHRLDAHPSTQIVSLDWSPDGKKIGVRDSMGVIRILDPMGNEMIEIEGDEEWYISQWSLDLDFSPDSTHLASVCADRSIKIWDSENGELITVLTGHTKRITDISWSTDGEWLASCSHDGYVKIWDMSKGKLHSNIHLGEVMMEGVDWSDKNSIAVSYLNSATGKRVLVIIDSEGKVLLTKEYGQGFLGCVSWSPGGDHLAVPNYMTRRDRTTIYTASGYPLGNLTSGIWEEVEWSPDGEYIASGGYDGVLKIYETDSIIGIVEPSLTMVLAICTIIVSKSGLPRVERG
jgi:WD40 repeat protein